MTHLLRRTTISVALVAMSFTFASHSLAGTTVYGNLGASGTNALGGTNTDYGPADSSELALAQGFSVGSTATNLQLQSVTVGLFATSSGSVPLTLSIWDTADALPSAALYTSGTVNVGNTGVYTFPFTGVTLSPSTDYWVIPNGSASWYTDAAGSTPVEQNSSGYTYLGTLRNQPSVGWSAPQFGIDAYSVSINAIPEPSSLMLSGIGIASALGLMLRRRRG